jgi:biopolymer transport protein ExbB
LLPRGLGVRALHLAVTVGVIAFVVRTAAAQDADADAAAAGADGLASNAWVLPIQSILAFEPISVIIALCSIVAVTLIIQSILRLRRSVLLPDDSNDEIDRLIREKKFRELVDYTAEDDSFVSRSLHPALQKAPSMTEMKESLETSVGDETAEEFRRLEYINILANAGPLLGLLGTVIGIMDAFLAMQRAGGAADVGALAGGISTALGTTMLGLLLAIPCLVAYGILRGQADRLTSEGSLAAEEFLGLIKAEGKGSSSSSSSSSRSSSSKPAAPAQPKAPARAAAPVPQA